jgi:hypothetical protein
MILIFTDDKLSVLLKDAVRTAQQISLSFINSNQRCISKYAVLSEIHTKHRNALCGMN